MSNTRLSRRMESLISLCKQHTSFQSPQTGFQAAAPVWCTLCKLNPVVSTVSQGSSFLLQPEEEIKAWMSWISHAWIHTGIWAWLCVTSRGTFSFHGRALFSFDGRNEARCYIRPRGPYMPWRHERRNGGSLGKLPEYHSVKTPGARDWPVPNIWAPALRSPSLLRRHQGWPEFTAHWIRFCSLAAHLLQRQVRRPLQMEAWLGYRLKAEQGWRWGRGQFQFTPPQGLFVNVPGTWARKYTVDLANRERPFAKQVI